ncbi:MAG: 30S ribosomal protein S12 methylthiotransferase RimO, partial [Deltaproteobacteria bacterium]|nr:30S ribosomal protein S12 methylthiotransferase RimO [Deltaproteobacteria bacterium]
IGVNEALLRQIVDSPVVTKYLDLPLQHISHDVLKSMRRPLGEKGTRRLIEEMRATAPQIALRTTFVVGFPGETEADVEALRSFVAEGHFTHVGVFTYSQEEEALAYTFPNQVDDDEKEARRAYVMEAQQEIVRQRNERLVGTELRVLIDDLHGESDYLLTARAEWQAPETDGEIILNDSDASLRDEEGDVDLEALRGRFGVAKITETAGYDLVATLVSVDE